MRAKNNSFPFDLDEIEQAYTENYVDDTDIADVNLKRNAAIAAKKISDKAKKICRKRKRDAPIEPIGGPLKRPKTSAGSKNQQYWQLKRLAINTKNYVINKNRNGR